MTYHSEVFIKEIDGIVAPAGFHYMPNGKLMSDADHIAMHGYIEKTITGFDVDTKDISYLGETKYFSVRGDKGAVFSLEIYDDATTPNYYNFNTNTWSSSKAGLNNIELTGNYRFSVEFPSIKFADATCDIEVGNVTVTHDADGDEIKVGMIVIGNGIPVGATVATSNKSTSFTLSAAATATRNNTALTFGGLIKKYTINLHAKTISNIKTNHIGYSEVRNLDNTINLNKSTGSNSDLISKIMYQDVKKNLYLSCIAPSLTTAGTNEVVASFVTNRVVITNDDATNPRVVQVGDKIISVTTSDQVPASVHALVTKIDPDGDNTKEIEINISDDITDTHPITFTPAFNGMTPNGVISTTGQQALEVSSGGSLKKSFSITCTALTGRTLTVLKTPTTNDLCAYKTVTFGADALAIPGEGGSSIYYRWPITNIAKLQEGMVLDPARPIAGGTGLNTTTPAKISRYSATKTSTEIVNRKYYTDVNSITIDDVSVDGVDSYNNPITAIDRNNIITAQEGNITFDVQQADALKADAGVRIFGYGAKHIKSLTGMDVAISNVVVTPTQVSTTTTGVVSNSVTIPVTEAGNISTLSTIRGVGIDSSVVNPTVSLKSGTSGGKNLTASAAQTLESGQTLYFDGASNIVTITGDIEMSNMSLDDTTLYFDVERFLLAR